MKFAKNKKLYLFPALIILLLLFLPLRNFIMNVNATDVIYQIRILEITESGATDLAALKSGMSNVTIDTMSMKHFVALRDDLDGKYDAVYIGKGVYTKTGVQGKTHNTKLVMNDITTLKAKEITDSFIDKGLYVIFNKAAFDAPNESSSRILYASFNKYRVLSPKSNVLFVNNAELTTMITNLNNGTSAYLAGLQQRPRLQITNKEDIIDYSENKDKIYVPGDDLSFKFNVSNVTSFQNRPILVKLYIGVDKAIKMTEDQVVATASLSQSSTGEIIYKLPKTYSGLLYWKLEISDSLNQSNLKDFSTGTIRFRGKKTIVNILQVLPNTGDESSLLKSSNMDQSFLNKDDYQLVITTKTMDQFNAYVAANDTKTPRYGLNGTYDMIIFGFRDVYNDKSPISTLSADAVTNFIRDTKQSVMFTHDTVYQNSSLWVSRFQTITGQIQPETNMGLNAPNKSTRVKSVNDGLLTQYPFDLKNLYTGDTANNITLNTVATTHDQYFTLDLNDPEVISWYNIESESSSTDKRDVEDSWNHYYTYSKGNVTYSGSGHFFSAESGVKFPIWEQRLFVNTMYRAFTGANHAPDITVHTPLDNSVKPSYQDKLVVSYTVDDWDLKDKNLFTSIKFKKDNVDIPGFKMDEKAILSGQTVTQTFNNPLPAGGNLQIEITARDSTGAISTKTVNVTVQRIDSNLSINRTLSTDTVERGKPIVISYSITPNAVPYLAVDSGEQGIASLIISNIQYEEKFPANLEFSALPEGTTKSGNLSDGYTLTRSLGKITYHLSETNGVKSYVPDSGQNISFNLTAIPNNKKSYLLDNSKLSFEDIHSATTALLPGEDYTMSSDYTVFMLEDINLASSGFTNEGRMAAARNIALSYYDVGAQLGSSATGTNIVVAGGNLTLGGGTINYGGAVYGGTAVVPDYMKSKVKQGTPLDFATASQYWLARSSSLATLTKTADTVANYYNNPTCTIELTGTNSALNVFSVSGNDLSKSNNLIVSAPAGSSVVVNVSGINPTFSNGLKLIGGVDSQHVIYNFYEATSIDIKSIDVLGTVIAPKANITFQGDIHGQMIGKSMTGGGHRVYLNPFTGTVPASPIVMPSPTPVARERKTIYFTPISFEALVKVSGLQLNSSRIRVGTELKLIPVITPDDANNKELTWVSEQPEIVTVSTTGVIKGIKEGLATIVITATDGSGIKTSATVEVISPNLTITGADQATVGEMVPFEASYMTAEEAITGYDWSIKPGANTAGATLTKDETPAIGSKSTLQATQSGSVTIVVTVKTDLNPTGAFTREHTIRIINPVREIRIEGERYVNVGEQIPLRVSVVQPASNADATSYIWSLEGTGSSFATIIKGTDTSSITLQGDHIAAESVRIKVSTNWPAPAVNIVAYADIAVGAKLTNVTLPESIGISVEETRDLLNLDLRLFPVNMTLADVSSKLIWSSSNTAIVSVTANGQIKGLKKGKAIVTVMYADNPLIRDTSEVSVSNEDRY